MDRRIKSSRVTGRANGCKVLVYGDSGAGKTRLLASAPKPLIISAEKGTMSLRGFDLPVWEINGFNDLVDVFKYLHSSAEARMFLTVCLDSGSEIAEKLYGELLKKHRDGRQLWPDLQNKIASAFRDFRDIPGKNVVMLAKMEGKADAMGNMKYKPNFPGNNLAQQAPYFFDEVFFLKTWRDTSGVRWWGLQTKATETHVAKDRSDTLAEMENADPNTGGGLSYIFNKMLG